VGSTGRCNTVDFRCCPNRRCRSGEAGSRPGGLSATGKKELWARWRAGESISDISRALQKPPGSIHGMLSALLRATGGFSPPERRRRRDAPSPSPSGRRSPAGSLYRGESFRAIARWLERSASTGWRELNHNGARTRYRAQKAEEQAWQSARPPKRCLLLLATNRFLRDAVARKLRGKAARRADLRLARKGVSSR
jgi:hypothetical protein